MLRSSLGFHTITASLQILSNDVQQLITDFRKYHSTIEPLKMYYRVPGEKQLRIYHPRDGNIFIPSYLSIYYENYNGIKWTIRSINNLYGHDPRYGFDISMVDATINPKMMGDVHNYITATYDDMDAVITSFNLEASKISPLLRNFCDYTLTRVDYCINFDLTELTDNCGPEQMMELSKRANIPHSYQEWTEYDKTAHRMKSKPGSFYLTNNSVTINCYSKFMQLCDRSKRNVESGFDAISPKTLDAAHNIIRFEVQCKYSKVYALSKKPWRQKISNITNIKFSLITNTALMSSVLITGKSLDKATGILYRMPLK